MTAGYVDAAIGIFILIALISGLARGLLLQLLDFVAIAVAVVVAISRYRPVADWLVASADLAPLVAKPLAFLGLWLAAEWILSSIFRFIYRRLPSAIRGSLANRLAGLVPAFLRSVIYLGLILTLILSLPLASAIKQPVERSVLAQAIVSRTNFLVHALEQSFGGSVSETFNFLTTSVGTPAEPQGLKAVAADRLEIEPELESQMLVLVNRERAKLGLNLLVEDERLRAVARAHSRDMWVRGFFDHTNPDGADPFDRITQADIPFAAAGENLALAPSIEIAHYGLMRSPTHRDNILFDGFGQVGIGVVSAGADGLMVTQNFMN